ncbi:P-loop containing nucleoside triphosphate hydrolase protein [Chytriomyces sp. MP71]|nr:P-loop containing nucleoside triphosphate hydrolase protein [Chytriomyces sp. MP71]
MCIHQGLPTRLKAPHPSTNPNITKGLPPKRPIPNVRRVIAVYSAKGGVGKSTTSVNIATSLAAKGIKTGILDADLFGPSIPIMMNLAGKEALLAPKSNLLQPMTNYGVECMSMGFLIDENQPVVWRGMMVMKAIQQLLWQVKWSELDVLVIDMPPGTGDTQISILQQVELNGAVIVSTPQDVALADTKKGISLFEKMNIEVENQLVTSPMC